MLTINKDKHLKTTINGLNNALEGIERAYKYPELKEIIELAVDWYENDNILYYSFFNHAFPCSEKDPTEFYGSLGSFLVNTILDDSYFLVKWERYTNGGYVEGTPFVDDPFVVWADDNGMSDGTKMLEAMKFAVEKDRNRTKQLEEWEKLKGTWNE